MVMMVMVVVVVVVVVMVMVVVVVVVVLAVADITYLLPYSSSSPGLCPKRDGHQAASRLLLRSCQETRDPHCDAVPSFVDWASPFPQLSWCGESVRRCPCHPA